MKTIIKRSSILINNPFIEERKDLFSIPKGDILYLHFGGTFSSCLGRRLYGQKTN